ncbi:MAG TPA: Hpt domain-containing protein [Pirellulaceae bacterium]|nr:Hpt domain-containing protein [Pirellulaceae bacterium]
MSTFTETEYLYSSLAGDPDLGEIIDLFVDEMPERVETLANCLGTGDWDQLRRYAHQMKGACGSYGFHQLTSYAARVENAVREAEEEQSIREAVDDLMGMCRKVRSTSGA